MSTNNYDSYCELAENWTSSKVKVDKATYAWTIDNFDFCETEGSFVDSSVFSASTNDEVKWYIQVRPNGETDSKDTVSLYLCLSQNSLHKDVFARFSLKIFNDKPKKEVSKSSTLVKFPADNGKWSWGYVDFCKKDENFRKDFLSGNVLKIYCEVIFSLKKDFVVKHHQHSNTSLKSNITDCDGTEILTTLLNTQLLTDVVIRVKSKEYPAHKAILAVRSKVFAAMFEHDTKENQLNRIDIEDMGEEIVGEMLRFIYTGKCEKLDVLAEGLLVAADKYDLAGLKVICSEALYKKLSIENAAQTLILADTHNASELKKEVTKFIVANSAVVFDTDGWKNIRSYPVLLEEILRAAVL